jgi:hypothetical protein
MKEAPQKQGYVLADIHTHFPKHRHHSKILSKLWSPGLVGLSLITKPKDAHRILSYEDVYEMFSESDLFEEIQEGAFARFGAGYILRTQELNGQKFHILGIGFEGPYLDNNRDELKAIEEIHKRGGLAQVNHPGVINGSGSVPYRKTISNDYSKLSELIDAADLVETFNAQNIHSYIGYLLKILPQYRELDPNMSDRNGFAEGLANTYIRNNFFSTRHTSSSDGRLISQVKSNGIYVPEDSIRSLDSLLSTLKGEMLEHAPHQECGQLSFILGMGECKLRELQYERKTA